jgi:primosomal protein N' (replication factor Y) (superfamily II helicase)
LIRDEQSSLIADSGDNLIDKNRGGQSLLTMKFYKVFLPLGLSHDLTYCSSQAIAYGARVLVPLNHKLMLGICDSESKPEAFACKEIAEILDEEGILPPELINLAKWMAEYYHSSVGKALFAMLPAKLQADVEATASWIGTEVPPEYEALHKALLNQDQTALSQIKKAHPALPVFKMALRAEEQGLIKLNTKVKHKDKAKVLNFIEIIDPHFDPETLPLKQREAWDIFAGYDKSFPMAEVSNRVSYSCIKAMVKKGIIRIKPRVVENAHLHRDPASPPKNITLNSAQEQAIREILESYGKFCVHLLYGITGSGKTEVYIELIRRYLAEGKSVIFLIPEIALTPQMVDRFDSSFGEILAIQHSQLSIAQRFSQWQKIKSGECRIIIGARSAIFAPVPKLGLIIVDEEHEQSYKQDNQPRYQGRDLAIVRAQMQGAQIVLGSATPALESWHNVELGKYQLHTLSQRPLSYSLPQVEIVNLCDVESTELLSDPLARAIIDRLEKKEQIILFQNRRGFSSFMQCLKCGKLITCPNCEISMYYHRDREEMQCHYCGHFYPTPRKCPSCNSFSFSYGAAGTQKVEQTLKILFPSAKILRLDSDSSRLSSKSMYQRMKKGEIDILLGTQMISKGLDFPNVTLVGIINADISLNIPDFRASERTFQLITQVAGRSGRAEKSGEVIIQTYNPDHYAIVNASKQDFRAFATEELSYRQRLHYPPYFRLARILYQSIDLEQISAFMAQLEHQCREMEDEHTQVLGPSPAPFAKINQQFRFHIIIKANGAQRIKAAIASIASAQRCPKGIYTQIDIDPAMLM